MFELTDAVLRAGGPVTSLVELTLVTEHRRAHGAMYDALSQGRLDPQRLHRALASLPLPRAADGRIVVAVVVSPLLHPDAPTSRDRLASPACVHPSKHASQSVYRGSHSGSHSAASKDRVKIRLIARRAYVEGIKYGITAGRSSEGGTRRSSTALLHYVGTTGFEPATP